LSKLKACSRLLWLCSK